MPGVRLVGNARAALSESDWPAPSGGVDADAIKMWAVVIEASADRKIPVAEASAAPVPMLCTVKLTLALTPSSVRPSTVKSGVTKGNCGLGWRPPQPGG